MQSIYQVYSLRVSKKTFLLLPIDAVGYILSLHFLLDSLHEKNIRNL